MRQKASQTVETFWIYFTVSGVDSGQIRLPGGKVEPNRKTPCLGIHVPGTYAEFEFNERRENWVVMLRTDDIRYLPENDQLELRDEGVWLPVPRVVDIPPEWVPRWQMEFQTLEQAFRSQLPTDRFRARLCVYNIIRYMLERQQEGLCESPARALKAKIDADQKFSRSLAELSVDCGYSSDHLRLLFEKEFRITPLSYRNQLRMARAMQFVASSRLAVKEIARQTGFSQVSHFSAAFRKAFQLSPREGIRRFRHAE
jgi:AraC-like DNA-binding protein